MDYLQHCFVRNLQELFIQDLVLVRLTTTDSAIPRQSLNGFNKHSSFNSNSSNSSINNNISKMNQTMTTPERNEVPVDRQIIRTSDAFSGHRGPQPISLCDAVVKNSFQFQSFLGQAFTRLPSNHEQARLFYYFTKDSSLKQHSHRSILRSTLLHFRQAIILKNRIRTYGYICSLKRTCVNAT